MCGHITMNEAQPPGGFFGERLPLFYPPGGLFSKEFTDCIAQI